MSQHMSRFFGHDRAGVTAQESENVVYKTKGDHHRQWTVVAAEGQHARVHARAADAPMGELCRIIHRGDTGVQRHYMVTMIRHDFIQ